MIPWLHRGTAFPPADQALREPNGLLAAGGDLGPERLLEAYRHGIFPWYGPGEPILWWSPDPRMVLFPRELRISRTLARRLKHREFDVRLDTSFAEVMAACAEPRRDGAGTWITPQMQAAYGRLHELGWAHSVESWSEGRLAGGLYGVAVGRMFYGESMFARQTDASKVALAHLVRHVERLGIDMIDCQMSTAHLASLGAREIPRAAFLGAVRELTAAGVAPGRWPAEAASNLFVVAP